MESQLKIGNHDLVGSIEAAYDLEANDGKWMKGLVKSIHPALDQGGGVLGFFYDVSGKDARIWGAKGVGAPAKLISGLIPLFGGFKPVELRNMLLYPRVMASSSEVLSPETLNRQTLTAPFRAFGIEDTVGIRCHEPEGWGAMFGFNVPHVTRIDVQTESVWSRFAAHVATALRMRRKLQTYTAADVPDAVLNAEGHVSHAENPAKGSQERELLSQAVRSRESARGSLRRTDPEEAASLWQALVDGQWSLVDQHDADGRRWILARRNAPSSVELPPLTGRERQVVAYVALGHSNKLVAYTLGLTVAAVGNLVARAAHKLGANNRVELIEQVKLGGGRPDDSTRAILTPGG